MPASPHRSIPFFERLLRSCSHVLLHGDAVRAVRDRPCASKPAKGSGSELSAQRSIHLLRVLGSDMTKEFCKSVGDFSDMLSQPTDGFGPFLEEALNVARVAHRYRGWCLLALVVTGSRASRQDQALVVRDSVPHSSPLSRCLVLCP